MHKLVIMAKYSVEIKETLSKVIEVEANSESDAIIKISQEYYDEEITLTSINHVDTEFEIV